MNIRLSEMNLPRFPLLSDEEMTELLIKAQEGDTLARERLINCNLRLVFNLVQRFANRGYELEDLFQIGTIGLIKAIDKFDLSYNVKFSTYAVPMIIGEIRRFLRDDNPVKVSRSLKENGYKIKKTRDALSKELGREPTLQEIAEKLNLSLEEIIISLEAVQVPTSIHETLYQDDGDPIYVIDQITTEKDEGSCIVVRVMKPGAVFEVGVFQSQFGSLIIHHLHKSLLGTGNMLRQGHTGVIPGGHGNSQKDFIN
jgi:RNA polymerase sporulation-specific sigma factor